MEDYIFCRGCMRAKNRRKNRVNQILDADEEADSASIGVSARDDGGDDAQLLTP